MSLETRKGRGIYYTRSKRIAGRIVRIYVGSGADAAEAATEDLERRQSRAREQARQRERDRELRVIDLVLGVYGRLVDRAIEAELMSAGIQRRRSEWRMIR
jgi:hypothetical protein